MDCLLLPNLGAEEGDDWRGFLREPATRVAARLWTHLFSRDALVRFPATHPQQGDVSWIDRSTTQFWPEALGAPAPQATYPWLEAADSIVPWFRSATIGDAMGDVGSNRDFSGPANEIVAQVHDKAFALSAARSLGLLPDSIASAFSVWRPHELARPASILAELETLLAQWPEWLQRRFTLKPRLGSSGRGRVGGMDTLDTASVRGALPRLAARGGAIFEPWFARRTDLSVCLHLPQPATNTTLPTLLGSLEMIATRSGGYRGHCGEMDNRGRVFSGHRLDEVIREQAAAVASIAQTRGYFGACGIDAFTYVESETQGAPEHLRPVVEFNARPTMGLVVLGLLRRVRAQQREALRLEPGQRAAFLFGLLGRDAPDLALRINEAGGTLGPAISLSSPDSDPMDPQPTLFFARELSPLREAYREHAGC